MPFGEIGEVGLIAVHVILLVEFSPDEHPVDHSSIQNSI